MEGNGAQPHQHSIRTGPAMYQGVSSYLGCRYLLGRQIPVPGHTSYMYISIYVQEVTCLTPYVPQAVASCTGLAIRVILTNRDSIMMTCRCVS